MDVANMIALAGMGLGALIWALRVESRVTVLQSQFEALEDRLQRIESLIDVRCTQIMKEMNRRR